MPMHRVPFALIYLLLPLGACEKRETDNPDVAGEYRKNKYQEEMVTGTYHDETGDQGKGILPATLAAIDDTIKHTYGPELHTCLEAVMQEHEYNYLRAVFLVEFTVEPTGKTHDARLRALDLSQQDARGHDIAKLATEGLGKCIVTAVNAWVFDPGPEVTFVDTYAGKLHEAY